MARPPPQGPGAKPLVPPLIGDEIFEVISSGGLRQIVTLQQIAEFIGGGGGVIATVPNGGTGLGALTLNGILYGNGVAPVGVTAAASEGNVLVAGSGGVPQWTGGPGSPGQALVSNGASAIPSFQTVSAGYPPSPTPDLGPWLQGHADAGTPAVWIWGNVQINNPIVVNYTSSRNSGFFDFQGATISPSDSYPVNTAVDMLSFVIPDTVIDVGVEGFWLQNLTIIGVNASSTVVCQNCVSLVSSLNANALYAGMIQACEFIAAGRSGLQLFGSIFEMTLVGNTARDNGYAGIELRNPTQGGGAGVISSIKFIGGDYRTNGAGGAGNGYGIASTAVTAFQEAMGFHIYAADFINNTSAGVFANSGVQLVDGTHFENNCDNNGGETAGQIWIPGGGGSHLRNCDAAFITSNPGIYLLEVSGGAGTFAVIYDHCSSLNESSDTPSPIGHLLGTGSAWIENFDSPSHYVGVGGWTVSTNLATATTV